MYTPDIINLRDFYATDFGESVRLLLADSIADFWQDFQAESLVGIGYATPYLQPYLGRVKILAACMPAQQGASYWPHDGDNIVLIVHEGELPFAENSLERILLVHSMENSEQLSWMIEELWRVLVPNGKLLAVVPNRGGAWARSSSSPFGYGRPFTMAQMNDLLSRQQFAVTRSGSALFMPPCRKSILWKIAGKVEKIGKFICNLFGGYLGGIIIVEAEKRIYSSIRQPVVEARNIRKSTVIAQPAMTMKKK